MKLRNHKILGGPNRVFKYSDPPFHLLLLMVEWVWLGWSSGHQQSIAESIGATNAAVPTSGHVPTLSDVSGGRSPQVADVVGEVNRSGLSGTNQMCVVLTNTGYVSPG